MEFNNSNDQFPPPPLQQNTNNDEFICFFCLRLHKKHIATIYYGNSSGKNEAIENQFSLRNICRFLQVSQEDREKLLGYDLEGKISVASENLVVSVCSNCEKLTKEFTDLYGVLEETKLRLKWCLEKIHGKMSDSCISSSGMVTFRTALMDRIKEKMDQFDPRLLITKVQPPATSPPAAYNFFQACAKLTELLTSNAEVKTENASLHGVSGNNAETEIVKEHHQNVYTDNPIKKTASALSRGECSEGSGIVSKREPVSKKKLLKCSFCRATFKEFTPNGARKGEQHLRRHVLQHHCEQLFPPSQHKLPSVTDTQFKTILGELLFKNLINVNEDTKCLYCNKKFKCPAENATANKINYLSAVKQHLYQHHFRELVKLIGELQRNPDLPNIISACNPEAEICECGAYLQNYKSRARHDKFDCPRQTSANFIRPRVLCKFCNEYVSSRNYSRHRKRFCTAKMNGNQPQLKEYVKDKDTISKIKGVKNGIEVKASTSTTTPQKKEQNIFEEHHHRYRFKDIQSDFVISSSEKGRNDKLICKFCKKSLCSKQNAIRHWNHYCPEGKRLPIPTSGNVTMKKRTCNYCTYKCGNRTDYMKRHLVRNHPEHFFPEERDSQTVLSSKWKKKHLGNILTQILFPEFISNSNTCTVCGRMYLYRCNSIELKLHLVGNHKDELKSRLKDLLAQPDASLEKMLQSKSSNFEVEQEIPMEKMQLKGLSEESDTSLEKMLQSNSSNFEDEEEIPINKIRDRNLLEQSDSDAFLEGMHVSTESNSSGLLEKMEEEIPMDISEYKVETEVVVVHPTDMDPVTIRGFPGKRILLLKTCNEFVSRGNYSRRRRKGICAANKERHSQVKECLQSAVSSLEMKGSSTTDTTTLTEYNKSEGNFVAKGKRKQNRFQDIKSNFISSSEGRNAKRVCKLCNKCVSNQPNAIRHWKYYCPKGKRLAIPTAGTLNCGYCTYKCVSRTNGKGKNHMKAHLVRNHPEQFFLEERNSLAGKSSSEWKKDHFRSILDKILFPKFISNSKSCSLCGKMYLYRSGSPDLRMHLINNHRQELQVQLKDILRQSDASVEEMFQSKPSPAEIDDKLSKEEIPMGKERLKDLLEQSDAQLEKMQRSSSNTSGLSEKEEDEIPTGVSGYKVKNELVVPSPHCHYSEEIPMDISECKVKGEVVVRSTDMDPITISGFSMNGNNNSLNTQGQDFSEQDDLMNGIVKYE